MPAGRGEGSSILEATRLCFPSTLRANATPITVNGLGVRGLVSEVSREKAVIELRQIWRQEFSFAVTRTRDAR